MQKYPEVFEELVNLLKTLPGIGRRSAERIAFSILKWPAKKSQTLGETIIELHKKITPCPECGNLASGNNLCPVCADSSRDKSLICVIENVAQIQNIENSGLFKGTYHVLGGKLSPLEGKGTEDLNIEALTRRIASSEIHEVILALSPDVEGQATAIYIANLLKNKKIKITRLAQGLPAGSDISYADSATIAAALNWRIPIN